MFRRFSSFVFSVIAVLLLAQGAAGKQYGRLEDLSLDQLERRLTEIDAELGNLAEYSFRGGVGSIGYQSNSHQQPDNAEWVRIDLGRAVPIDQIILVPTLRRDSQADPQARGFPVRFRILAGDGKTTTVVASFTREDGLLPRIAPLAVPCPAINASWIRVEVTELSDRGTEKQYALQLSEILVFSGLENVALAQPVSASSSKQRFKSRQTRYLTDGFMPYRMDAAHGIKSDSCFFGSDHPFQNLALTIDLQEPFPVNQIYLHAVDSYLTIPEDGSSSAIPPHIRVTGANRPDFADEALLFEFQQTSEYDVGPIMCHRFPEKTCRYIRFEIFEFQRFELARRVLFNAGFSEIEVLSNGHNVAAGKPVRGNNRPASENDLALLTDGNNYSGEILPMRTWLGQLAKRHDLEKERPLVVAELNLRYALQKRNLNIMYWLAALLCAGTVIIVLLEKTMRQRAVFQTQKRIAANLHDELGANLHAARVYSDLLKKEVAKGDVAAHFDKLINYADEINSITDQAAKTTRFCTNMLEAKGLYENPAEEMKRIAKQILADQEHDLSLTGEELLKTLQPRRRIGLVLFYKECLTNIIRHSGATRVETRLTADRRRVCLTVKDNGNGTGTTSPSLKRRARLLKARVSETYCAEGGTETKLLLTIKKQYRRRIQ
jgi:signal transduction histidine kinase